jgi:hypothetical protein
MVEPLKWYDHNADNPLSWQKSARWPAGKADPTTTYRAFIVSTGQYAESALGDRSYFLTKLYSIGSSKKGDVP